MNFRHLDDSPSKTRVARATALTTASTLVTTLACCSRQWRVCRRMLWPNFDAVCLSERSTCNKMPRTASTIGIYENSTRNLIRFQLTVEIGKIYQLNFRKCLMKYIPRCWCQRRPPGFSHRFPSQSWWRLPLRWQRSWPKFPWIQARAPGRKLRPPPF